MKPLYPDGRQDGLPTHRADGTHIGPVLRVLVIVILATTAALIAASGFDVNEATTFAQRQCSGRGALLCELGNWLAAQIPPSAAGAVDRLLRVGFFVLLLGLIAGLLRPLLRRRV